MSIDQRKIVDLIGTRRSDGRCVLTISDHLAWDDPDHVEKLQEKINDYLAFIESGEIYESRPDARGREIEIEVVCKYFPPQGDGVRFVEHATEIIRGAGLHFSVSTLSDTQNEIA